MKILPLILTVIAGLSFVTACAHPQPPAKPRPRAKLTDDREYNAQSREWETSQEATGINVMRRYEH